MVKWGHKEFSNWEYSYEQIRERDRERERNQRQRQRQARYIAVVRTYKTDRPCQPIVRNQVR